MGRSYLHAPTQTEVNLHGDGAQRSFIPKKLIHTWTGHTKPVNNVIFFPKTSHLILSASMDTKVKLWYSIINNREVYGERKILRTFSGHSKGVRDIDFSTDGREFLSCSFDKTIKKWDVETGQCTSKFAVAKTPLCIKHYPIDSNLFLVGCQDRKILLFDSRSSQVVREYAQHSGAVNSINFIDDSRRFVSSSDDKSLRIWEFDTPTVVKYIRDPELASMPSVSISHDERYICASSLDNSIQTFSAVEPFKHMRAKTFRGHLTAGYACRASISPDGRFVSCGDSTGYLYFWDWKTMKVNRKFKAHEGVVGFVGWNRHEGSRVISAGWDGVIKYWD